MKSAVKLILLFACLFALAQWASHLDLSFFWGGSADASEPAAQTTGPQTETPSGGSFDVRDWLDGRLADGLRSSDGG